MTLLEEIMHEVKKEIEKTRGFSVTGILIIPIYDGAKMTCYTDLNPGYKQMPKSENADFDFCVYSDKYMEHHNMRKQTHKRKYTAISEDCESCEFTPSKSSHFNLVIHCYLTNDYDKAKSHDIIGNAVKLVNGNLTPKIRNYKIYIKNLEDYNF